MKKRTLTKSKIGYTGVGADGRPIEWNYRWNPCGFGCSNVNSCPGCYAHKQATGKGPTAPKCPDCAAFKVHLHPERLCEPANTRKPGVVLCNFLADTFDAHRTQDEIFTTLAASELPAKAERHVYVWLTKQPNVMKISLLGSPIRMGQNHYFGGTIRNQADADAKLAHLKQVRGRKWLSIEPLWSATELFDIERFCGVIVGQDRNFDAPGTDTLDHVRSVVQQCQAANVPVFVKQLWLLTCNECGKNQQDSGKEGWPCAGDCPGRLKWKLHTAPSAFPLRLQFRNLPWSAPK